MKEDKENARPKERRGAAAGPGALLGAGTATGTDGRAGGAELDRLERPKDKKETLSKVVIRRLPPSLTKEQLEEHLQPLPEHDYFEFFANDSSLYPHMFSRAYINFKNQEDIVLFRDRFDGYVFVDHKGQEYAAIVEFAPFQKAAKKKSKKKDAKTGTIEDDPEYKKFLESYSADDEKLTSTPETLLEEIEARNKELIAKKTTPLLNFLKNKQRLREEKREERRRRELERKRQREEERRKWKEEERRKRKEAEKLKKVDRCPEKERDRSKEEPKIKLLKKPEKDEKDLEKKEKSKKLEKEALREEKNASSASAKRSDGETKEEKAKKIVQLCSCTNQEPEAEADCVSMKTVLQSPQIREQIRNKRVRPVPRRKRSD
ncbi:regulator of nonsense transcripts 3B isoform X2 [Columba livia]|uniref:regulator of nonsense transcripts 3B isoform X2 n=1 Tax=Columba livia TaxID=8932 RepID=UPI0031BB4FF8